MSTNSPSMHIQTFPKIHPFWCRHLSLNAMCVFLGHCLSGTCPQCPPPLHAFRLSTFFLADFPVVLFILVYFDICHEMFLKLFLSAMSASLTCSLFRPSTFFLADFPALFFIFVTVIFVMKCFLKLFLSAMSSSLTCFRPSTFLPTHNHIPCSLQYTSPKIKEGGQRLFQKIIQRGRGRLFLHGPSIFSSSSIAESATRTS